MSIELRQKELHNWQIDNFGKNDDDSDRVFQGIVEELGEMAHAILKYKQHIRQFHLLTECNYQEEKRKLRALVADAFGDIVVFGIQLMTEYEIDAEEAVKTTIETVLKRDWKANSESGIKTNKTIKTNTDVRIRQRYNNCNNRFDKTECIGCNGYPDCKEENDI